MRSLLENCQIDYVGAAVSAGSSIDNNSSRLDMSGWDGVVFFTTITDSVATGVATLTVQQADTDADTNMAAITGASATVTCATNDDVNNTLLIVDVQKPMKRYVQGTRTSATANIAYGEAIAIRYQGRKPPITQSSTTVSDSTSVVGS